MCQLLGMNSSKPAALGFSFGGIAFHTSDGCRLVTDHLSAADSPLADAVKRAPVKARNVVAHIRKATQGRIAPENSHPFTRTLWGRDWSFAHNGDLKDYAPAAGPFQPAGDTDSECACCNAFRTARRRAANWSRRWPGWPPPSPPTALSISSCPTASCCSPTARRSCTT